VNDPADALARALEQRKLGFLRRSALRVTSPALIVAALFAISGCSAQHRLSATEQQQVLGLINAIQRDAKSASARLGELDRYASLRNRVRRVVYRWAREETAVFAIDPGAGLGAVDAYLGRLERLSPTLVRYDKHGRRNQINYQALAQLTRPPSRDPRLTRYRTDIGVRIGRLERLVKGEPGKSLIHVAPTDPAVSLRLLISRLSQAVSGDATLGRRLLRLEASLS
jgi:hypothetical protein